jgi:antirestriction protein ArdC
MPSPTEIRRQLTEKIVAAIESGVMPWRKTWISPKNTGRASNVASGRSYRGINPLLLQIAAIEHGFKSRWWATYLGWQKLGGCQVMKRPADVPQGKWGTQIVFYRPVNKTVVDPKTGEQEEEKFCVLRTFTVFNADQVCGPNAHLYQVPQDWEAGCVHPDFAPADKLIADTGANIRYGGDQAYYRQPCPIGSWPHHSNGDFIQMPLKSNFVTEGAFYETTFHELAHWSEVRVKWNGGREMQELIAEMAACFVSAELGIPNGEPLENHASYVQSWLQSMRGGDATFIFRAASQASKVADYLLAFARKPEEATEPEESCVPSF